MSSQARSFLVLMRLQVVLCAVRACIFLTREAAHLLAVDGNAQAGRWYELQTAPCQIGETHKRVEDEIVIENALANFATHHGAHSGGRDRHRHLLDQDSRITDFSAFQAQEVGVQIDGPYKMFFKFKRLSAALQYTTCCIDVGGC